jgi:two-component system, cell cycle response regulator
MTSLLQAALTVRTRARASLAYATAGGLALLDLFGIFRDRDQLGMEHAVVLGAALCVLGAHALGQLRGERPRSPAGFFVLDQALVLLALAHALLQLSGGLSSVGYPALYLLAAFIGSFAERQVARLFVLSAVLFEAPLYFLTEGHRDGWTFVLHVVFLGLFGCMNLIFTHTELTRARLRTLQDRAAEKRRVQDEARLFRLGEIPQPTTPTASSGRLQKGREQTRAEAEEKLFQSSVEEVRHALHWNLDLLKRTLALHSVALFLRDDGSDQLRIALAVSDATDLREGPFQLGEGAIGACYQRGLAMNLEHLRPGYSGLCYYRGAVPVRAFVALPVKQRGNTLGVLCADRLEDRPFSVDEERTLANAVDHVLRALENERVFVRLERSKREHSVLYHASAALGAAANEQAVLDAALHAAAQIVGYDFAAVTHYDQRTGQHSIRRAIGEGAAELLHLSFRDNTSLTAMAVHNRHYLPYRGDFDSQSQVVYTRNRNLSGMHSLLIMPLVVREVAIGTLALAARRRDAFGAEVRPALQLLANQLAVALSNAASVARLEELATTDGLTGCYNKRHFSDELKARMQAAQRFGRKLSLVITDLDHFKTVNDTYGHHTGDVVIRELGQILMRLKRETDVVARFGGEEFCLLCEETTNEGARLLAERVRHELEQTTFETELGPLRVTASLGVATYPEHGADKETLFDAADKALYAAKHNGRNRVCSPDRPAGAATADASALG